MIPLGWFLGWHPRFSKQEVILVSCGPTQPLWQKRPRLTGRQWPGTQQPLGHLMSPLSLTSSPGSPMATQLFCGSQCPLVTATVSHPFISTSFLGLLVGGSHVFRDNLTLLKEGQCWLYSAWSQSQSRGDAAASHSLFGVLHRTGLLHDQKLVFCILWGSVF